MTLMCLINKLQIPTSVGKEPIGEILIGRISTTQIGRKCTTSIDIDLRQHVVLIDNNPLIMSGSLRRNLDPYGRHTD